VIPQAFVNAWAQVAPWADPNQVEQDLVLGRLIVEIASHPQLTDELVFRGGTCLHKLHLPNPLRYSEDLDYVRATHGPIGPVLDALRDIAAELGMDVATDVSQFPKCFYRSTFESGGGRLQVKVEINTYETSPARPHLRVPFAIESPWWSGRADILTFEPAELVATKLRALYQRRKGRDLFDLWLALTRMGVEPSEIIECFAPYRPDSYTSEAAIANLRGHLADELFRDDLAPLLAPIEPGTLGVATLGGPDSSAIADYDVDGAADLVIAELLSVL